MAVFAGFWRVCAMSVAMMGLSGVAQAAPYELRQTFDDPTVTRFSNDDFGSGLSLSGDNVLIGAAGDDTNGTDVGQAHIFSASTGKLLRTFNNPTPDRTKDSFGFSVSISGDNAVVGAHTEDTNANRSGQAHLFSASTGNLLHTFNDPTPTAFAEFGFSVSVSGDNVLIGTPSDITNSNQSGGFGAGEAHLFSASTGKLLRTFKDPTPTGIDRFGRSVSISGDHVLIGARSDDTNGFSSGQAHLFSASTGELLHTFNNPTPEVADGFGHSVSVSGDNVLIGASGDDTNGRDAGQAYLFSASTGALKLTLDDPFPEDEDNFGWSVSVSEDTALVGAFRDSTTNGVPFSGQAHLFDTTTGELLQTLNAPNARFGDNFGGTVFLKDGKALVGANEHGTTNRVIGPGQAHLFTLEGDTVVVPSIPEPATWALLGIGIFGLGVMRRRRRGAIGG